MIYLISDLHGGESMKGLEEYLRSAGENDLLIVLGDIGMCFEKTEENRRFTEYFLSLKRPIAIVDGNHENHPYLRSFPVDTAFGAPVYRLSECIVYLQRGNIYQIEGKSFFVMGGCKSSEKWEKLGLLYPNEEPSEEEVALARKNLLLHQNRVDYILTHLYQKPKAHNQTPTPLEELTAYLDSQVSFQHWYSGHAHKFVKHDGLHTVVYDEPVVVGKS